MFRIVISPVVHTGQGRKAKEWCEAVIIQGLRCPYRIDKSGTCRHRLVQGDLVRYPLATEQGPKSIDGSAQRAGTMTVPLIWLRNRGPMTVHCGVLQKTTYKGEAKTTQRKETKLMMRSRVGKS